MAINIPIISSLNSAGFDKAKKEFQSLDGAAAKSKFAIQKAAVPAAAAFTGIATALGFAAKAAIQDQKEQAILAQTLRNTTGASVLQTRAVEDFITQQSRAAAVADSELRPALGNLLRATGDVTKAQELLSLGLDIAGSTGKDVEAVSMALSKAYNGNLGALTKLGIPLDASILKTKDFKAAQDKLTKTFNGGAATAANSIAGKFRNISISLDETKESIGKSLLPAVEAVLPFLQKLARWAEDNPTVFRNVALAIAGVTAAVIGLNIALNLNPFVAIATAIGVAIVALVALYTKFEGFRVVVNKVINAVIGYFEMMVNNWIFSVNLFIKILNGMSSALKWIGIDLGKLDAIGKVTLGRLDDTAETAAEKAYALAKSWSDVQGTMKAATPTIDDTTGATGKAGAAAKKTAKDTKELTDAQKNLKTAMDNAVQTVKDKFSPALMRANDLLTTATDNYNNFYNATADVVRGIFNVGDAWTTAADSEGAKTFFGVLDEQAKKAGDLSTGIEKLIAAGLDDPALLKSILDSGADVGLEIINGLLAGGKASIDRLVGISSTINAAADRIAKITADKWYKSGVDQAQQIVNGVNSVIENTEFLLKFAVDPASVAAIGAQFGANIGTVQAGGVPTLTSNPFGGVLGSINTSTNADMSQFGGGNVSSSSVTINVNGGDPNAVVSALRAYMRTNGSVPIKVSNAY
jgi:hypothetical protein